MILKEIEDEPLELTDENDMLLTECCAILSLIHKDLDRMYENTKKKINVSLAEIDTLMTLINSVENKIDEANKISQQLFNLYKEINNS